jgi:ABC-type multidrug transport system permease subunit
MDYNERSIGDRKGFLFLCVMVWFVRAWLSSLHSCTYHKLVICAELWISTLVPAEKAVVRKERLSGAYRLSAYFIAKSLCNTPVELTLPIIYGIISYWMVGLNRTPENFFIFLLILALAANVGSSIGLAIGASVSNVPRALSMSIAVSLSSMLIGGFYVDPRNIPVWLRWARWLSPFTYGAVAEKRT